MLNINKPMAPNKEKSVPCTSKTKASDNTLPCKRRTIKTKDKCWTHAKSEFGVMVKPSKLRGKGDGLYSSRFIKGGSRTVDILPEISGLRKVDKQERRALWAGKPRAKFYLEDESGMEAYDTELKQTTIARYVQPCDGPTGDLTKCNTNITKNGGLVSVKNKDIGKGGELYAKRGATYHSDSVPMVPEESSSDTVIYDLNELYAGDTEIYDVDDYSIDDNLLAEVLDEDFNINFAYFED